MIETITILREKKSDRQGREIENRVILTPPLLAELVRGLPGKTFLVERGAGEKIDHPDQEYEAAGARLCCREEALAGDLILGVKETALSDFPKIKNSAIFFSFQHFAASRERTEAALNSQATFVALETIEEKRDGLPFFPCLRPMSEAAAKIVARHADEYALLSRKVITSGLPETGLHGVKAVILGGGAAGKTAAEEFSERGCEVALLEKDPTRVRQLEDYFTSHAIRFPKVKLLELSDENLRTSLREAFFLISAVYNAGKKPEKLVTLNLLKTMAPGGCVYPIDIDQGGTVEGVVETSPLEPFQLPVIPGSEVFFFAPPNLPSLGAKTTSEALGTVVLPFLRELIEKGLDQATKDNAALKAGLNIEKGEIVHPGLATVWSILPHKKLEPAGIFSS